MLISTRGRYALRVLIDIAEHQADGYLPLKEVAQRQEISEKYLEAILKVLVKERVLTGIRGKGGGYRLSRAPDQFTVREILQMTEESLAPVSCLDVGSEPCARAADCRTVGLWQGLNQVICDYLDRYTIADLMRAGEPGDNYII